MIELPEPLAMVAQFFGEWRETDSVAGQPVYTASQMREHEARVRAEALEEAAKACERRITNEPGLQREDYENRQCAAAIRAIIEGDGSLRDKGESNG